MSSPERSVQLILGQQQAEEYVCGLHHRGGAQGQVSISDARRIYFRSVCEQISFTDGILVTWMLRFCLCFLEVENKFVLRLVHSADASQEMHHTWEQKMYLGDPAMLDRNLAESIKTIRCVHTL